MRRRPLHELSKRDLLLILVPTLLCLAGGLWLAAHFIKPAPPDRIVMATGVPGGGYAELGEKYRAVLARHGVTLELRPTEGSVENYGLVRDPKSGVDVAFMQSGIGVPDEATNLVSLGSVAYEPLWVFCRGKERLDDVPQLRGRRIAIGPPGSGTHVLARDILKSNGLDAESVAGVHVTGLDGAEALFHGVVDCLFVIAPPEAGIILALVSSPDVSLMNFARAHAYLRRLQYLSEATLPAGVFDLERQVPPRDVTLLAATAQLVARADLHPAIQGLLLQAAEEIHGRGGLFHRKGEFPANRWYDFPISPDAQRYFTSGKPFLQRYLPFWLANLVDRIIVLLIPMVAVIFPLTRIIPPVYKWRVRSRIYRWYGELMFIENETRAGLTAGEKRDFAVRLDRIEATLNNLEPPLAYADQLYALRQHVDFVRDKLTRAATGPD